MADVTRNRWAWALRGAAAIIFGLLTFIWPGISLLILVTLFGAYALVDGIFAIVAAFSRHRAEGQRWLLALAGMVGIVAGVFTFLWPGVTALGLLYIIAVWALVTGVLEIVAAIRLRREIRGEWALIVGGVLTVLFGLALAISPGAGALAVLWLIASYAIAFGILMIIQSFRVHPPREA